MPRFHLNIFDRATDAPDDEGHQCADLAAARAEAIRGIRSLLADGMAEGAIDLRGRIEITDPHGHILETIAFRDAVKIEG